VADGARRKRLEGESARPFSRQKMVQITDIMVGNQPFTG
jgi:hypothetical protein